MPQIYFNFFSSEDDILKELEELSWEAQGIKTDRETAAVKVKDVCYPAVLLSASFRVLLLDIFDVRACLCVCVLYVYICVYVKTLYKLLCQ